MLSDEEWIRKSAMPDVVAFKASIGSGAMRVAYTFAVALALVACSRTEELSGDVFVTMKSGDVKRGANVEIALIPATEQFESEWKKTVGEFKLNYASAESSAQQAREVSDQAYKRYSDSIGSRIGANFTESERKSWNSESERASAAQEYVQEVRARYHEAARKVIAAAQPRTVRTDVNGHYEFRGVPHGRYYIFAAHQVFENDLHWIVPVEVKSQPNLIDLSNNNEGWPF